MKTRSLHQPAGSGAVGDSAPDSHVAHVNRARNVSNHSAAMARLPDMSAPSPSMPAVEGMVDLPTLAKIFEVLSTSQVRSTPLLLSESLRTSVFMDASAILTVHSQPLIGYTLIEY
jgi:hypothetical protein